jgi:Arc/MetJ-type ribon-helix-helix transcriptional regulator
MVEVEESVRVPISITVPKEVLVWLDEKVKSRVYANRSHAVEVIVLEAMKNEKKE